MPTSSVRSVLTFVVSALLLWTHAFADPVEVALITDGPQYQLQDVEDIFTDELLALTSGEFEIKFTKYPADWSVQSVERALASAYNNPSIDLVLVLGFAANQLVVSRELFAKPTFLPLVFNADLLDAPNVAQGSGRRNLNYLADRVPFKNDLATFQRVIPFRHAALLTDAVIIEAIPQAPAIVREQGQGVAFSFIGHDGVDHNLVGKLPKDVDAVLLGGLPRLPPPLFDALLNDLIARELPVFSLVSETEVLRGALAADVAQTDYRRIARRNALNIQAVLLGERTDQQPVIYEGKRRLTINMATARAIGLSPTFDVLSEADLVNAAPDTTGPALTLNTVAELAIAQNLDLAVSVYDVEIGEQDIRDARSNLLPQVSLGASQVIRRDEALARSAAFPEQSTSGLASLTQPLFVESARSGYQQQKLLQDGRVAALEAARLDSVLDATSAYLQALRAQNQLRIQQQNLDLTKSNLELARDRVRAGSASNADIFRWESSLATARSSVLSALASQQQAYDDLSRILNRDLGTTPDLQMPTPDEPFGTSAEYFNALVNNPRRFAWFAEFVTNDGLSRSPELAQLDAQINATERDVLARRRAFWAPDVSLQAQYTDNFDVSGLGSGTPLDDLNDWSVTLSASWPLFDSGQRRSQLSRSRLLVDQLNTQRAATALQIEQNIRASLLAAQATYANIEYSRDGAEAARKNLALVSDAYQKGAVSIIDLLDAQSQSLQADLSANNAIHDFLLNVMNLQRASNSFDFLLPADERAQRTQSLIQFITEKEAQRRAPGAQP
ncbi:MAG: TolC family protein [Pseudomonadota bacterium]